MDNQIKTKERYKSKHIYFSKSILIIIILLPVLFHFNAQLTRHLLSVGGGGYFDEPGIGWVAIYSCILGGLTGLASVSLYLALISLLSRKITSLVFLVLAFIFFIPPTKFLSNTTYAERNQFILWTAYKIFYEPFAQSTPPEDSPFPANYLTCIKPKTKIEIFDEHNGNFSISTGQGTLRTYSWAGQSRSISMTPTTVIGAKRLSYPANFSDRGKRWPGFDWKMHDGLARCCSLETVINFDSEEKAINWIQKEQSQGIPFVYRNDGLFVQWSKEIESNTLWIIVHQLLVNDRKPRRLPGASDSRIREIKIPI